MNVNLSLFESILENIPSHSKLLFYILDNVESSHVEYFGLGYGDTQAVTAIIHSNHTDSVNAYLNRRLNYLTCGMYLSLEIYFKKGRVWLCFIKVYRIFLNRLKWIVMDFLYRFDKGRLVSCL